MFIFTHNGVLNVNHIIEAKLNCTLYRRSDDDKTVAVELWMTDEVFKPRPSRVFEFDSEENAWKFLNQIYEREFIA